MVHRPRRSWRYRRLVIDPTGPHPPSVYWRRRAVALGGSILLVILLAVAISSWLGGGSRATAHQAAEQSDVTDTSAMTSSPPTSGTIAQAAGSSSASAASSTTVPPTTTTPPPPGPCPDPAITVEARVAQPQYKVGQSPLLTLVITNSGPVACNRDLSRQLRELVVLTGDGKTRLWSSADCFYQQPPESRLLQPGEQASYSIAWAGLTSAPHCAPSGTRVPAGNYVVVGKLGGLTSQPTPLRLV